MPTACVSARALVAIQFGEASKSPFPDTICEPKQVELRPKNVKQKNILWAMSSFRIYAATSASSHYNWKIKSLFRTITC